MYYEIYRDGQGYWRWRLRAANHETLASGESYVNKADCTRAIVLVKGSNPAPVIER
jgi:uncharacterized protein YegP (UPF0339 family)